MNVKDHYQNHLANVYSWMLGDFEERMQEQMGFFRRHRILPSVNRTAIDLGAGNGIQSVALARLGFSVTAVDFNTQLLEELRRNKGSMAVTTCESDLLHFINAHNQSVALIVCMGDTLTHLRDKTEIAQLIGGCRSLLMPGGKIVLSFRDLSLERTGSDRFIHVRSDDHRILTCFLEYFPDVVTVYDVITEKKDGQWRQRVSSYPKVRLSANAAKQILAESSIAVVSEEEIKGMTYLVGTVHADVIH